MMRNILQVTLAILKPDCASHPHIVKSVEQIIMKKEISIICSKPFYLGKNDVERFYEEHREKFFYNRLVNYMSSGPVIAYILAHPDCIHLWRSMMGSTKVYKTIIDDPDSIRGQYGLTDTRNCCHGSDSIESAIKEIQFFFPEFKIDPWLP